MLVLYWQRWLVLFSFSMFTMWQCSVWNTWGPISETAKTEFGWTDSTLVQFNLWGILTFFLACPASAYVLSNNLRLSVVLAAGCMFLGTTIS